jgi:outer membrane protein assembly factor BamA
LSTGVGVRWLIAGILPLLLDYGTVLNRRPGEGFGRLHFNIGYTF